MKNVNYLLLFISAVFILSCESVTNNDDLVTGRVIYNELNAPAINASIFYGSSLLYSDYFFTQLTHSGNQGYFNIEKPEDNSCIKNIYAIKEIAGKKHISPILKVYFGDLEKKLILDDLTLFEKHNESNVTGVLIDDEYDSPEFDVSNNLIYLYYLENMNYIKVDSTYSDSVGTFEFTNLSTSNYYVKPIPSIGRFVNRAFFFVDGVNDIDIVIVYGIQLP